MIEHRGLSISATWLPPEVSQSDPLAQRGYLGVKLVGDISTVVTSDDPDEGLKALVREIAKQAETALRLALQRPDESVAPPPAA